MSAEDEGRLAATLAEIDARSDINTYQKQARALLASDWLASREAAATRARAEAWWEGHLDGCEDSGRLSGTSHREMHYPLNPYRADSLAPDTAGECTPKTGWLSNETYCALHGRSSGWPCTTAGEDTP